MSLQDEVIDHRRPMPTGSNGASRHETKHERFLRIGTSRVRRALQAIDLVGKLASSKNEYSEHEARQMLDALGDRLDEITDRLVPQESQKKDFAFE